MPEVTTSAESATPPSSANGESGTAADAKQKVQDVAGQAQEKAQEAKEQAGGKVREQVDQRSTQAGEQVSATASDLRTVGEELRKQGKDTPAKLADQAAERSERLGSYLTESDADTILSDVEDFARRQPWAVVAGGLALGFAASRFLKASSSQRYSQRGSSASAGSPAQNGVGATLPPPTSESSGALDGTAVADVPPPTGAPIAGGAAPVGPATGLS
jgi:hypothetical protein